jgi:hypothetical protein
MCLSDNGWKVYDVAHSGSAGARDRTVIEAP